MYLNVPPVDASVRAWMTVELEVKLEEVVLVACAEASPLEVVRAYVHVYVVSRDPMSNRAMCGAGTLFDRACMISLLLVSSSFFFS